MLNQWKKWESRPDWLTVTGRYNQVRREDKGVPERYEDALTLAISIRDSIFGGFVIEGEPFVKQRPPQYYKYAFALKATGMVIAFGSEVVVDDHLV
jgi:hypothetical protein